MGTCKDCVSFKRVEGEFELRYHGKDAGTCDNKHFIYADNGKVPADSLAYWDYEGYSAGFHVGANFGCIHFKAR